MVKILSPNILYLLRLKLCDVAVTSLVQLLTDVLV